MGRAMASTTATASSWSEIQKQSSNSTPVLTNFLADFISSSKQSSSTICNEKNNIKNCQSANTSEKNVVDKNLHHNGLIPDSVVQLCSTKKPLKQRFLPSIGNINVGCSDKNTIVFTSKKNIVEAKVCH